MCALYHDLWLTIDEVVAETSFCEFIFPHFEVKFKEYSNLVSEQARDMLPPLRVKTKQKKKIPETTCPTLG